MKKFLSILLAIILVASTASVVAFAAGNSFSNATSVTMGTTYNGTITTSTNADYYKFTLSSSGKVKIDYSAYINRSTLFIYDSNGNTVWDPGYFYLNADSVTGKLAYSTNVDLCSGTYYLLVSKYGGDTGKYSIKLSFTSANESFKESNGGSNNSMSTASSISLNTSYKGQIASNDEKDFYKFKLTSSEKVEISLEAYCDRISLTIFDSKGNKVWDTGYVFNYLTADSTTGKISYSEKTSTLSSGTYYFCVERNAGKTGNYSFKLSTSGSTTTPSNSVDLKVAQSEVIIKKGEATTVNCSYTGSNSNGVTISCSVDDKNVASTSWGEWSNKKIPLTINGLSEGQTKIKVTLKDSSTKAVLDTEYITITVNSEGEDDSDNGGGLTGFFLIDLIIFILSLIFIWFI